MPRTRATTAQARPVQGDTPQAMMRREHAGKWLAWSEDENRIIGVGDTAEEVQAAAGRAGHSRFIYDWAPSSETRQTTGLE